MIKTMHVDQLFEKLFEVFTNKRFLLKEALGGEIPFFILPFEPTEQVQMDENIPFLMRRLESANIKVLEINLFRLCIDILKQQGVLESALSSESELSKSEFQEALNGPLNVENEVIPAIRQTLQETDANIVFLTGIGAIFPIIRSHTILNNLQTLIKDVPLVMFFPGNYNNLSLTLFGKLKDDNYYRAFNLNDYTI